MNGGTIEIWGGGMRLGEVASEAGLSNVYVETRGPGLERVG